MITAMHCSKEIPLPQVPWTWQLSTYLSHRAVWVACPLLKFWRVSMNDGVGRIPTALKVCS
jgi:hypothetical protein